MNTDFVRLVAAALSLPSSLRGELAAKLVASLGEEFAPFNDRSAEEWHAIIMARSDAIHRGEAKLIEGGELLARLQAVIDRAAAKK